MNTQDKWISISLGIVILIHLTVWVAGYFNNKLFSLISFLNLAFAISILAYWIINQLRIQQHTIELREVVVLIFEVMVAASALYNTISAGNYKSLRILQYIFFGLDITILIAALIFMLTFKITRLF